MSRAVGAAAVGAVAVVTARAAYAGLRRRPPAGEKTWSRANHRGERVTLLEGPAVAVGAISAELIAAAVAARSADGTVADGTVAGSAVAGSAVAGTVLAGGGALAFGLIDDLAGSGKRRGLRGHLGALAHGEVTTGTVKLGGLAATGLVAALLTRRGSVTDVVINAGLIAGGANLLNLFDLRPGRAIKVAVLSGGLIAGGGALTGKGSAGLLAVIPPVGAALALLPEDLGERAMLGDAGANALGAMLGEAAARSLPRPARIGLLTGIVALTVASEKVSFTRVIERTPPLRRLDMLGRRPVLLAAPPVADAEPDVCAQTPPPRPRMGRHRRVGSRVGRVRSGARFFQFFLKTPAHQEP